MGDVKGCIFRDEPKAFKVTFVGGILSGQVFCTGPLTLHSFNFIKALTLYINYVTALHRDLNMNQY